MKKKILSLIILVLSNLGFSQWDIQSNIFFSKIQVTNYDTIYAYAGNLGIMKTTDNALTWNNAFPNSVLDFTFKNSDTGLTIKNDTIYKTLDGSSSWQYSTTLNSNPIIKKVICSRDSSTFFVYGANFYWTGNPPANILQKTTDNGNSWSQITLPSPIIGTETLYLQSMIALDEQNLYLYYRAAPSGVNYELKSFDGGINWEPYIISPIMDYIVSNDIKYAHYNNFFLKTVDAGQVWDTIQISTNANIIVEVDFIDENFGAVVCTTFVDSVQWIYRTCDGGYSWSSDTVNIPINSNYLFGPTDLDLYAYNYGFIGTFRLDTSLSHLLILNNVVPDSTDCTYIPSDTTSGLNSFSKNSKIEIFPNPSIGLINIKLKSSEEVNIQIANTKGQIVYNNNHINSNGLIHIDLDLLQGLYIIIIKDSLNLVTKKFVIK
ncbi:hypothetical protein DNU06_09935 [Putridiphycobacter roseus]|uniref:Secretion system C-terminal sorting domain-containing protein n=1 Tax=Putridiphycobacter roseus TaxID=2219161 RepID=A0A2W1NG98_9FLAO|nr:T9SS type A sorting domain-containing protein [Putridiphycobacter roseus]PZE17056.1 hypothetical protein DNU06_09935 [Putridiphycobacter roseus]